MRDALIAVVVGALRYSSVLQVNDLKIVRDVYVSSTIEKEYIQIDDWIAGKFRSKSIFPQWVSEREHAVRNIDDAIVKVHIETEQELILLNSSAWQSLESPYDFIVSADQQYVAIMFKIVKGYAHYTTSFSVAVFETSDSTRVAIPGFAIHQFQKIKWDPVGHKMAFVHNFDVYVVIEFSKPPIRLTHNGKENEQFNGITDWIHELEITSDDALLWWSPSGIYLAYASLNQSKVKDFDFALFDGMAYPNMISYSYPKPGTPIPVTQTFIFNTKSIESEAQHVSPSNIVLEWKDYYLNSVLWTSDSIFTPTWKNRFGNETISETCVNASETWTCDHVPVMVDRSETGWLGHYNPADLVATGRDNEYLTVLSDGTGFLHLVVVDTVNNTKNWRTNGSFEVTDTDVGDRGIYFYDSKNDFVYFTSTEIEGNPGCGHGDNKTRECITCELNEKFIGRCNWVDPSFSHEGEFVVINCGGSGNGIPISILHKISPDGTIEFLKVVEDNTDLQQMLNTHHYRTREYGSIEIPDVPEEKFYYALHKPPKFDPAKKYPMLVLVYSGPAYQNVEDKYNFDWSMGYIASSDLDIVVMTFDGRGTGFRGDKIMHMVYKHLGKYEPLDQIEAARQVADKYDFIDKQRIAIWGRSYGGYVTARTVAEDAGRIFKCGISVAPVTDWKTYSTLYTERYMGMPENNQDGYAESSAIQKLENYRKHYFILVHGTSDENVHFLHSSRLSTALIDADIDFGAYFAGDENHRFTKHSNGHGHHYKLLTHHVKTCFGL